MNVYHDIKDFKVSGTVTTTGVFDGLHTGHRSLINRIKTLAESTHKETAVFTFWPHPRMIVQPDNHGLKLLNSIQEKIAIFKTTGIDHLVIYPFTSDFSKLSSCEFITRILVEKMQISSLVIGYNHHFGHKRKGTYNDLVKCARENNFSIERLEPFIIDGINISSTLIRDNLLNGNLVKANRYLGYNYFLSGKVIEGSRIGRSIGFPTANIQADDELKLIPKDGVYAVKIDYENRQYHGMLNIGLRPTVENNSMKKSIEVHIFDFDHIIYGKNITIRFIERIRDEIKFKAVENLQKQLQKDKEKIQQILR